MNVRHTILPVVARQIALPALCFSQYCIISKLHFLYLAKLEQQMRKVSTKMSSADGVHVGEMGDKKLRGAKLTKIDVYHQRKVMCVCVCLPQQWSCLPGMS
jgi:hypothetical protein